jgi:hypothetical protein
MQVPDGKNKFPVMVFFKSVNINIMAEAWAEISTSLDFEKIYAVISFKIFNAVSGEKK